MPIVKVIPVNNTESKIKIVATTNGSDVLKIIEAPGRTGIQGIQGTQGVQGTQGLRGTQGTQGLQGTQGTQGVQGTQGLQGTQGTQGIQGVQGTQGIQGIFGNTGDPGIVSQTEAPTDTDILWLDTDEPAVAPATIAVTAPIVNTGTTENAIVGIDLSNIGVKYASPWQVKYRSGYWYEPKNGSQILVSTYSLNRLLLVPLFVTETITIDRIGAECTSPVNFSTFRLGIYNSDSNGVPSTLLLDAGTIDTSTLGAKTITISQTLTAGLYYLAGGQQGGSTNVTMRAYHNVIGDHSPVASTSMTAANAYYTGFNQDSVTGAFPSTYTANNPNILQQPRIQFRVA